MVKDVIELRIFRDRRQSFPGGSVVKHLPASAGDMGSILDQGGSPCGAAPKPAHHYYGTCALEPGAVTTDSRQPYSPFSTTMEFATVRLCCRAQELQLLMPTCPRTFGPQQEKPFQWGPLLLHRKYGSPCSPQLEKSPCSKGDPAQP